MNIKELLGRVEQGETTQHDADELRQYLNLETLRRVAGMNAEIETLVGKMADDGELIITRGDGKFWAWWTQANGMRWTGNGATLMAALRELAA